jgi:hypothetical protein
MASIFDTDTDDTGAAFFPDRPVSVRMPELLSRQDFYDKFSEDYGDGQHLTELGPTQRGKSRMGKELLKRVISPERKMLVLCGKPPGRERTWDKDAADDLNLIHLEQWPPNPYQKWRGRDHNGWLLQPKLKLQDPTEDEEILQRNFRPAIMANHRSNAKTITVVDEGYQVHVDLKLKKHCEASLMRGAPDDSVWTFVQRGRYVSYLCYDAPEHVLIFRDDDRANQQRYSEIGGVDSRYLSAIVTNLRTERVKSGPTSTATISQAVYFRRSGSEIYIIDT